MHIFDDFDDKSYLISFLRRRLCERDDDDDDDEAFAFLLSLWYVCTSLYRSLR